MEWYPCSYSGGDWDSLLDTHGVTPGPQTFPADRGLPFAGTPYQGNVDSIYPDLHHFVKKHKSGFYTVLFNNSWYNVLSLRHRNGYADGENYGLIIYCRMTDLSGDLCWVRQAGVDKNETSRILLDSKNYSSRIFPIVHGNEVNYVYNMDSRTSDYMWINYRDAKETGASKPILEYYFGNGSGTYAFAGIVCNYFRAVSNDRTSITTPVNTNTYLNGAKGERVAINMTAAAGFNIIARVKSTNGQFIFGCYNGDFQLYYIADSLVNANSNSYTWGITLMNEDGHLMPTKSGRQHLGSSNAKWYTIYGSVLRVDNAYLSTIYHQSNGSTKIVMSSDMTLYGKKDVVFFSSYNSTDISNAVKFYVKRANSTVYAGAGLYAYSGNSNIYFTPTTDNLCYLGQTNVRWKEIYAINSTISTSDRREKKNISYIGLYSGEDTYMSDDTLQSFIRGLLPCIYLRIDGDSGRPHHGFIAQDVEKLMQELGIKDHAAFIKSPKTETVEIEEEAEETYTDETDGQTRTRTVIQKREEQREIPGEYIYGLRYEEFIADIVRFVQIQDERIERQERKINSLEGRLSALENILNASTG